MPPSVPVGREHPLIGRTLGDFVVEEKLGSGGFGDVYVATQPVLARTAVIKTLRLELTGTDIVQRFLREARVASSLDHPYAAHIYAFGAEPDGTLWIAMERVNGVTLAEMIATSGALPLSRLLPLTERICEVLHTAHERGIVHRDIKPANIMVLSRAGRLLPKLLDFGIAKALAGDVVGPGSELDPADPTKLDASINMVLSRAGIDAGGKVVKTGRVLIGSPHYMPPEQWVDPHGADKRADIYALGLVFYEALTGKVAFTGPTVMAIAAAHARKPPPELPSEFSPALAQVVARATAKVAGDRYATALEFAEALRAASGEAIVDGGLPAFDDTLRDAVLATAPQPIADAVSTYEAAVTPERAAAALIGIADTIARYLALVAIAARARTGGLPTSGEVVELIRRLRETGLELRAWIALARAACGEFADRADVFPIPELPLLLGPASDRAALIDELAALDPATVDGANPVTLHLIERVLGATRFLSDYPLVAVLDGSPRSWMGARRRRRALARLAPGVELAAAEPALVDATGTPVVPLYPLVQIAAPSPGGEDELFLLERGDHLGAQLVARPVGYERHDDAAWSFFGGIIDTGASATVDERARSPYRGLSSFSAEDVDWFFGREREAEAFANRLHEQAFIAVVGPSGVGKSSFIKAGVLPRLGAARTIVLRPGERPLAALAAALSIKPADLTTPDALRRHATAIADGGAQVVIVVDQFEELVTLCRDPDERERFGAMLVDAGSSVDAPVRVIVTLRDDFLVRLESVPTLRNHLGRGLQLLATPVAADLIRILVEPARKAGYSFDDDELPARIVADVEARPGALALLSFTALRLWELRDERYRHLKRASYDAMGGVGGALAQHAEDTLAALAEDARPLVREAFRHLVTAEGTRAVMSKVELAQVLGGGERADAVIQTLIGARLLASSEGVGGTDQVEVVHEALLSAWPRLVDWRREDAETARLRDQLRAAARQWDERDRSRGLLWRGDALLELGLWRARYPGKLTDREEAFAAASLADAARGKRIRRTLLAAAVTVLAIASVVLLMMYRASQQQKRAALAARGEARQRVVDLLVEGGRAAVVDDRPLEAMVYLDAAHDRGAASPELDYLVGRAVDVLGLQRHSLEGHTGWVNTVALSSDGTLVATGGGMPDQTVRIWDTATGAKQRELALPKPVKRVQFRPGTTELMITTGARMLLWDARTGQTYYDLVLPAESWGGFAAISPDGTRAIAVPYGAPAQLHDGRTGALIKTLPSGPSVSAALSPSGALAVVSNEANDVVVFSTADGAEVMRTNLGLGVGPVAISPDDRYIVAGNSLGPAKVVVWDRTGHAVTTLTGHRLEINGVTVSSDSTQLITASEDGTARLWDLATGRLIASFEGHRAPVNAARFDPSGKYVVTASADGTAKLWLRSDGTLLTTFHGHSDNLTDLELSTDGATLATASVDGTAKLWSVQVPGVVAEQQVVAGGAGGVTPLSDGSLIGIAPDGAAVLLVDGKPAALAPAPADVAPAPVDASYVETRRLATLSADGSTIAAPIGTEVAIWDRKTGALRGRCRGHAGQVTVVRFLADGRLVSGDDAGALRVCDPGTFTSTDLVAKAHRSAVSDIELDPTGPGFITAGDRRVIVWRPDGSVERELTGNTNGVSAVRVSADGKRLVTSSLDTTVRVLDRATGKVIAILKAPAQLVSVTADRDLVVAGAGDGRLFVWETATWRLIAVLGVRDATVDWLELRGNELYASDTTGRLRRWRIARAANLSGLASYVQCRVPYELENDQPRLRPLAPDRPCAGVEPPALAGP